MVLVWCMPCRAVPLAQDAVPLFWRAIRRFLLRGSVKGSRFFLLAVCPSWRWLYGWSPWTCHPGPGNSLIRRASLAWLCRQGLVEHCLLLTESMFFIPILEESSW